MSIPLRKESRQDTILSNQLNCFQSRSRSFSLMTVHQVNWWALSLLRPTHNGNYESLVLPSLSQQSARCCQQATLIQSFQHLKTMRNKNTHLPKMSTKYPMTSASLMIWFLVQSTTTRTLTTSSKTMLLRNS